MPIPHVPVRGMVLASTQNALIDRVNQNTDDIGDLRAVVGPAIIQGLIDASLSVHVEDVLPHPVYDEIPSLSTLFENGLA